MILPFLQPFTNISSSYIIENEMKPYGNTYHFFPVMTLYLPSRGSQNLCPQAEVVSSLMTFYYSSLIIMA